MFGVLIIHDEVRFRRRGCYVTKLEPFEAMQLVMCADHEDIFCSAIDGALVGKE